MHRCWLWVLVQLYLYEGVLVFLHFISGQSGLLVFFPWISFPASLVTTFFSGLCFRWWQGDLRLMISRKYLLESENAFSLSLYPSPNLYRYLKASLSSFGWNDLSTYQQMTLALWFFSDQAYTELSNLCHSPAHDEISLTACCQTCSRLLGAPTNAILKAGKNTSLLAQWIRLHLLRQGTQAPSLVWEDSTHQGATKPMCCNHWSPCSATREQPPTLCN